MVNVNSTTQAASRDRLSKAIKKVSTPQAITGAQSTDLAVISYVEFAKDLGEIVDNLMVDPNKIAHAKRVLLNEASITSPSGKFVGHRPLAISIWRLVENPESMDLGVGVVLLPRIHA